MQVQVRLYGQLSDLSDGRELSVPVGAPRSVKDLVESVGVPHPEIALLVVDDVPVGFDHPVVGGERVAVYPPFASLDLDGVTTVWPAPIAPRFVLDVHLGTLTRRLRVLGFDSWYRSDATDTDLADVAVADRRILLTRDRGLLMRRVIVHGYCPRSDDPDEQLAEVARRYDLADDIAPLTRCARCNGALEPVDPGSVHDEVPPRTRIAFRTFARCTVCQRVYWRGAHHGALLRIIRGVSAEGGAATGMS